jgi:CspA family cold shock protein
VFGCLANDLATDLFSFRLFLGSGKMPQGTIKKLTDKGFGFIEGERGDIFFHHSSLEGVTFESLREGQQVEYEEGRGPKGPRAENVKVVA